MGVFEKEKIVAKKFITFGAKKYAYTDEGDDIHVTISGVNPKKGAEELKEKGGLEKLTEFFIFEKAGGNEFIYNDEKTHTISVEGKEIEVTPNIYGEDDFYTLRLEKNYKNLIENVFFKQYYE